MLLLLLLLAWKLVCGVCPNHEVVMFQPRTLAPPYIGSVIKCYIATPFFLTRSALLRPPPDFCMGGGVDRIRPWPLSCLLLSFSYTVSFAHLGVTGFRPSIPIPISPCPIFWLFCFPVSSSALAPPAGIPAPLPYHRQNIC